jgi:membrane-associated phospholipid phosphatase
VQLRVRVLGALAVTIVVIVFSPRMKRPLRAAVRAAGTIALASFLFSAVAGLQHMLTDSWNDAALIAFETQFTGIELSHMLERITTPALTEWLMASYVLYVPLMPFTAWVVYRVAGEREMYAYLFSLLAVNLLCDLGFVLYPVASQLFFDPDQYTVPLTGGLFTDAANWIRANEHYPGGSFPSPHNAAGTVMFLFLWRTHRRWAAIMTPLLLSIPLATVYGRFHYLSDAVVGVTMAGILVYLVLRAGVPRPQTRSAVSPAQPAFLNPFPRLQSEQSSSRGSS